MNVATTDVRQDRKSVFVPATVAQHVILVYSPSGDDTPPVATIMTCDDEHIALATAENIAMLMPYHITKVLNLSKLTSKRIN